MRRRPPFLAGALGALLASSCSAPPTPAPAPSDVRSVQVAPAGPTPARLGPQRMRTLAWDRVGSWDARRISVGAGIPVLVSRDPLGDRLITRLGAGFVVWRGTLDCARGTLVVEAGTLHASPTEPAVATEGFPARPTPSDVREMCSPGEGVLGVPAAVYSTIQSDGRRSLPSSEAEYLARMRTIRQR